MEIAETEFAFPWNLLKLICVSMEFAELSKLEFTWNLQNMSLRFLAICRVSVGASMEFLEPEFMFLGNFQILSWCFHEIFSVVVGA